MTTPLIESNTEIIDEDDIENAHRTSPIHFNTDKLLASTPFQEDERY